MNKREVARLAKLYVQLSDLAEQNRGYQDDANGQQMTKLAYKYQGAAIAYEFAAGRIKDVFLGRGG